MKNVDLYQEALVLYEESIKNIMQLFLEKFDTMNPLSKWRDGSIDRIGYLDEDNKIEYALHGAGCIVEFENGTIVSFDFEKNSAGYTFDPYKFKIFIETNPLLIKDKDFLIGKLG